ncbi:MAG: hypothetical protein GX590_08405 [Lentisphaerae bacterium]|nr:hypothetical protein [Lentisphaerota bacterium]
MKRSSPTVVVLLAGLAAFRPAQAAVPTRQRYPLAPERVQANAARVARDIAASPASWRSAPLVYYTVPAISPVKRLSDSFPADGTALAPLEYVAAQGEYEAGSIQVFPLADVDRFELRPQELKSRAGAVIPAAALDIGRTTTSRRSSTVQPTGSRRIARPTPSPIPICWRICGGTMS